MSTHPLLMKFKDKDTPNTVTRKTVKAMASKLGFNETQLINYALARLREDVLPALPEDAPELSAKAMKAIRARYGHLEADYHPTSSLIEGL
ncbi:MAG: hypothetical protein JSS44_04900 [Proteobacteria bacterium]|nr:hypothetical protein [Pseudomonadota bacterium]